MQFVTGLLDDVAASLDPAFLNAVQLPAIPGVVLATLDQVGGPTDRLTGNPHFAFSMEGASDVTMSACVDAQRLQATLGGTAALSLFKAMTRATQTQNGTLTQRRSPGGRLTCVAASDLSSAECALTGLVWFFVDPQYQGPFCAM